MGDIIDPFRPAARRGHDIGLPRIVRETCWYLDAPAFWQDTPAPYGPLFILLAQGVVLLVGQNVLLGVVLMVGGNIPGETRVIAIAVYEHVETMSYAAAHTLSAGLLGFSFVALVLVYALNRRFPIRIMAGPRR